MPVAADILSTLPDPLLCRILSKIPIREAVRCAVLAKRWRFLYAQIPRLTLAPFLLLRSVDPHPDPLSVATVEKIIFHLLLSHSTDLEAFHLFNNTSEFGAIGFNSWCFAPQSVCQWVRYAASKNVQSLTLADSVSIVLLKKIVPPALFYCTRLTMLTLHNYSLTSIPTHFSGFNHLITCSFHSMEFIDESLARFISRTPILEDFSLFECVGLKKPVISAPNLKHLYIVVVEMEMLTITCPKLRTLKLSAETCVKQLIMIHDLRVNGVLFHELSFSVFLIEYLDDRNIAELRLDLCEKPFSADRFLEIVGPLKTLKALYIIHWPLLERESQMVDLFDNLLETFPALEQLELEGIFELELVRDPMLPCTTSLLDNLRKVKLNMIQFDKGEIAVMGKLLQSASALEIMEVQLPYLGYRKRESRTVTILKRLLYLRRASIGARISVEEYD